jgi:hypothetical protein
MSQVVVLLASGSQLRALVARGEEAQAAFRLSALLQEPRSEPPRRRLNPKRLPSPSSVPPQFATNPPGNFLLPPVSN